MAHDLSTPNMVRVPKWHEAPHDPGFTPTQVRAFRHQIAAQVKANGWGHHQAKACNENIGWNVTIAGYLIQGYRWGKGEWALIARIMED